MKAVLYETRELLKNKTFEEQLEIMFQMRKKYLKLNHLEWNILDILDNGEVYYVEVEEDSMGVFEDDRHCVWRYKYTKEEVKKNIFRYIGYYEHCFSMKELTRWFYNYKRNKKNITRRTNVDY